MPVSSSESIWLMQRLSQLCFHYYLSAMQAVTVSSTLMLLQMLQRLKLNPARYVSGLRAFPLVNKTYEMITKFRVVCNCNDDHTTQ